MSKLEEMLRKGGANIAESMGSGVTRGPGSTPLATSGTPARWQGVVRSKSAAEIPVSRIEPDPDQPREEFDEEALGRLAQSLKVRGQLQPIRVRWDEGRGCYVIVCGERRWRAATMAGLATICAVVVDGDVSPEERLADQVIENCLRQDLRPIEQARAFRTLIDSNAWTVRQMAEELAISHVSVVRALSLLELPAQVQELVEQGGLPPATAYEISKVEDPGAQQDLASRAAAEGLTRSAVVEAIRHRKDPRPRPRCTVYQVPGGKVTVALDDPDAGDDAALQAVQAAARAIRKSGRTDGPARVDAA